jgi:ferric-dicitrate binding protein FerR (iron transport regulator)
MEDRLLQHIRQEARDTIHQPIVRRVHFLRRTGWWAAAAVLIVLLTGVAYWLLNKGPQQQPVATVAVENDVQPGRQGALLTLADGRVVLLDSLVDGVIASEKGAQVVLEDGQLTYKPSTVHDAQTAYNTVSTPRGRQFALQLPDGTKVWLNAASSLRYPVVFTGTERKVEITGEAYFEVARVRLTGAGGAGRKMPFKVIINNHTTVEVLGTHFNVNAYNDENSVNTTLLEGAVKVSHEKYIQLLQPGQQAQVLNKTGAITLVKDADVTAAVAWKNGTFSFSNANLQTVMRELARWYNIDVEYTGDVSYGAFTGEIGRTLTLDQVLKGLTKTRVHYKIEKNNKLLIQP